MWLAGSALSNLAGYFHPCAPAGVEKFNSLATAESCTRVQSWGSASLPPLLPHHRTTTPQVTVLGLVGGTKECWGSF